MNKERIILVISIVVTIGLLFYFLVIPYFIRIGYQKAEIDYANNNLIPLRVPVVDENNQTTFQVTPTPLDDYGNAWCNNFMNNNLNMIREKVC